MERPKYVLDSTVIINHLNNKLDIETFLPRCHTMNGL
jgi:hypothetical protein